MFDPNRFYTWATPHRYYQNGHDVTWYVMNNIAPPISERFFPVTCK